MCKFARQQFGTLSIAIHDSAVKFGASPRCGWSRMSPARWPRSFLAIEGANERRSDRVGRSRKRCDQSALQPDSVARVRGSASMSAIIQGRFTVGEIAKALEGEVAGDQVVAPGPGHSRRDRSLCVRLSAAAPDGFVAFSHAGDDWRACRDHVRARLLPWGPIHRRAAPTKDARRRHHRADHAVAIDTDRAAKIAAAIRIWREGVDPRGTPAERYLTARGLALDAVSAFGALRWHPGIGAMLALFRSLATGEPQAVSRTFLDVDARKVDRRFLGPVAGAAVMLDPSEAVTLGLLVAEGVETALAARMLGLTPAWALGSAGAIAAFPVLAGVEALTIAGENDDAGARAVAGCGERWHAAGREVRIVRSERGKDLADDFRAGDA